MYKNEGEDLRFYFYCTNSNILVEFLVVYRISDILVLLSEKQEFPSWKK